MSARRRPLHLDLIQLELDLQNFKRVDQSLCQDVSDHDSLPANAIERLSEHETAPS